MCSLKNELVKLANSPINDYESAEAFLLNQGFQHHIYPTDKSEMSGKYGVYIFVFDTYPENFENIWKEHCDHGVSITKLSKKSNSKEIMYVGEARGSMINTRLRAHVVEYNTYGGTTAMKLEDPILTNSNLDWTCHCFVTDAKDWDDKVYITIFEKMLHAKLNPRIGQSR